MKVTGSWEDVWDALNEAFSDLAARLGDRNPRLTWSVGHHESEAFPFTGYITFSRDGIPGQEDLVVSVGVQRKDSYLLWRSDLSLGDGEILADGPEKCAHELLPLVSWVNGPLSETLDFIKGCEVLLAERLR